MDPVLRALNRFGLGARPGESGRIGEARSWLRAQLRGGAPVIDAPVGEAEIPAALRDLRMRNRLSERERTEARRRLLGLVTAETSAALNARILSDRPFVERLVAFWSNHLCVSVAGRQILGPLVGSYEREAIRPHVLGRFEEMVLASARHPTMLVYLDNVQSVGPGSRAARLRRGNAQLGLNENYARELLELHTLGVDGGYTQQDVQELARLLTGWTVRGLVPRPPQRYATNEEIRFGFEPLLHEPGTKTILGERYGEGEREGERAIRMLCRHPSTARFVATKLVTHFVSDDPPAAAVTRIADVFGATRGDLRAVADALIELPEAWRPDTRKFRTPHDWLVAVLRGAAVGEAGAQLAPMLRQLRQPLWSPPSPKGYSDVMQDWSDPDSLLNRAELARSLGRRTMRRVDPAAFVDIIDIGDGDPLRSLLRDASIEAGERFALAIASPAFQWR